MLARLAAIFTLAAGALGCAAAASTAASTAATPWVEVSSPRFTMRSDLDSDAAGEMLGALEQAHAELRGRAFPTEMVEPPGRIALVAFARREDYDALSPPGPDGYFVQELPGDVEPAPTFVMRGRLDEVKRGLIRREIGRYFASWSIGMAWGLARRLQYGPDEYRGRYSVLAKLLRQGAPFADAWQSAFPRTDMGALKMPEETTTPLAPSQLPRSLTKAEVHLLRARLQPWTGARAAMAKRDIEAAIESNRHAAEAYYLRGMFALKIEGDLELAFSHFAQMLAEKPGDPRYTLALAMLLDGAEQRGRTVGSPGILHNLVGNLTLTATTAAEVDFLARHLRRTRRLDEARTAAERSVKLDPACASCLDTLAQVSYDRGDLAEAVHAEERAVAVLPEGPESRRFEERLRKYMDAYARQREDVPPPKD